MDENTEIEFEVREDREGSSFAIDAVITEDGVQVNIDEVLGNLKPYIKNAILYPNPTEGVVKMDYLVYRRMDALNVQIMDLNGKELINKPISHQLGNHTMEVDLTEYESGTYIMQLNNGDNEFSMNIRIVKQ